MANREDLERKKEKILEQETTFAYQIGAAVLERPKVSIWMILVPILFLYFIYQMQKYKSSFTKFTEDFMITRKRALDVAVESVEKDAEPDVDRIVGESSLSDTLRPPYESWVRVLVEYYSDLLAASGDSFESLVQSAYNSQTNYLLILNRLGMAEKGFYSAIKTQMADTQGSQAIIATIEERSQSLRRDLARQVFA